MEQVPVAIQQVLDLNVSQLVRGRFNKRLFLGQTRLCRCRTGVTFAASDCDQAFKKENVGNTGGEERRSVERITQGRHDGESNEKDEWRVNHSSLCASYILFLLFLQGQP